MPGDNARYYIKMLVYKEVYQHFLYTEEKRGSKGVGYSSVRGKKVI